MANHFIKRKQQESGQTDSFPDGSCICCFASVLWLIILLMYYGRLVSTFKIPMRGWGVRKPLGGVDVQ